MIKLGLLSEEKFWELDYRTKLESFNQRAFSTSVPAYC